jgi:aminocarboxymuconate-semialdehyde decarboxylase
MESVSATAIDIHAHVVPATFPRSLHGSAGWPSMEAMEPVDACHRNIVIDGKVYRKLSDKCWETPKRLVDMDAMGVGLQAVSPMPELFSYWIGAAAANDLLRYINDQTAEFVAASNGRMVGLAAVPLQDLDLALAELHRAIHDFGFAGVEVGSNVNGVPIGSPAFDPFFAEAEKLYAAIFVHAVRPAGMERLVGPKPLEQVLGYPTDVGLAAASMITANTLARFPRLRVGFSHGGGTLASLLPRLAEGVRVFPALQQSIHEDVYAQARRFFYDTLVYDAPTLRHLCDVLGDTQLMVGTDYPFNFHERRPVDRVLEAVADADARERLLHGNARRFLNLSRAAEAAA